MKNAISLFLSTFLLFSTFCRADEKKEQKDNIDKEVTNPRLRAVSGSRSKWSLSFGLNYNGGTITDPFGRTRPDIYGNPENERLTSLGGSVSVRYRFDKKNSMTLGLGLSYLAPLRKLSDSNNKQMNILNPGLGYSRVERLGIFQLVSGVDYIVGTSESYKRQKINGVLDLSTTLLTNFNDSPFNLGLSFSFSNYFYRNRPVHNDNRSSYALGFYPFFEFRITQVFYFRTVFGYFNYEHLRGDENQKFTHMRTTPSYQSVGVGMALSRDVYIYPNIQFLPKEFKSEKTNLAISVTINLF